MRVFIFWNVNTRKSQFELRVFNFVLYFSIFDHLFQLTKTIETLNAKLIEKGKEIVDYKEKNNIQFQVPEKIIEEDESPKSESPRNLGVLAAR